MLRIILGLLFLPCAFAAIDVYEFATPTQEQQYRLLIEELRCPKCQNQNIADSNAPLAADLRQKVYTMVLEGKDNREIKAYMTERYGDFVSYRPPLKPMTWLLWFGPVAGIVLAALALFIWIKRRNRQSASADLSDQERARLAQVLDQK